MVLPPMDFESIAYTIPPLARVRSEQEIAKQFRHSPTIFRLPRLVPLNKIDNATGITYSKENGTRYSSL